MEEEEEEKEVRFKFEVPGGKNHTKNAFADTGFVVAIDVRRPRRYVTGSVVRR